MNTRTSLQILSSIIILATAVGCGSPDANIATDGTDGKTGATGPQGPAGPKGDTGPAGAQGLPGKEGLAGAAGPKGDKGDKGDIGPAGAPGTAGPKGDTGSMGPSGAPGANGLPGAAGPKGDRGLQGVPGTSITRDGIYVVRAQAIATSGTMNVAASCNAPTDVLLSGSCTVSNPADAILFGGSPRGYADNYGGTPDKTVPLAWQCTGVHSATTANAAISAFATCLIVN
jgi:hypothetical protein